MGEEGATVSRISVVFPAQTQFIFRRWSALRLHTRMLWQKSWWEQKTSSTQDSMVLSQRDLLLYILPSSQTTTGPTVSLDQTLVAHSHYFSHNRLRNYCKRWWTFASAGTNPQRSWGKIGVIQSRSKLLPAVGLRIWSRDLMEKSRTIKWRFSSTWARINGLMEIRKPMQSCMFRISEYGKGMVMYLPGSFVHLIFFSSLTVLT